MTNPENSEQSQLPANDTRVSPPKLNTSGNPRPLATMPRQKTHSLLFGLFFYPRLAILNARVHCMWFRTLAIIVVSAIVAAIIQAAIATPEIDKQCKNIVKSCADTLQSITYHTDKKTFSWGNDKLTLPYTQSTDGFKIDVIASKESFDRKAAIASDDDSGIVFSPQTIAFWMRNAADEQYIILFDNISHNNLSSIFRSVGEPHENSFTLSHDNILQIGLGMEIWIIVFFAVKFLFIYFQMIFTCVVIFVIMSLLFNRIDKAPFTAVVASSFACVIPPFLLTLVASLFPQIPMDVDTLFTIFFVIYLIIIFFDKSVVIRRQEKA